MQELNCPNCKGKGKIISSNYIGFWEQEVDYAFVCQGKCGRHFAIPFTLKQATEVWESRAWNENLIKKLDKLF